MANLKLELKRNEYHKLVALSQIHAREIRIMEIEEEIERCRADVIVQQGVLNDLDIKFKASVSDQ